MAGVVLHADRAFRDVVGIAHGQGFQFPVKVVDYTRWHFSLGMANADRIDYCGQSVLRTVLFRSHRREHHCGFARSLVFRNHYVCIIFWISDPNMIIHIAIGVLPQAWHLSFFVIMVYNFIKIRKITYSTWGLSKYS